MPACEVKNNCTLFETLFKVKKNGAFLFGIFFLEIFTFLYFANEESEYGEKERSEVCVYI